MKARTLTKTGIKIFLTLIFSFFLLTSYAQYENTSGQKKEGTVKKRPAPQKPRRWFAGGIIGAGFSSYSSYVEVSPLVGYKITPAFLVGTRITYIWNSYEMPNGQRESLNHYGISLFAQYIIFKGLFAHVEYEALSFDYFEYDREWINSLFIGGGYMQDIGGRGFASFALLFNVLDSPDSPYVNPIFRIGFGVGF